MTSQASGAQVRDPDKTTQLPQKASAVNGLRALLLRVHFYAGLLIGPFLLVAAVTGLCYTATPQLEKAVYRHELKVTPEAERQSLATQVSAAKKAVPDGALVSVRVGATDTDSTRVVFEEEGLREGYTRTAFVNPYNHQVLGTLETFGQWLPLRAWVDDLHRNLHLGELGRNYSEIAASWLWVEVAAGLVLWTGARRSRKRLRRTLLPERSAAKGRPRLKSWHGTAGLWLSAGLLGLAATGLTWSNYAGAHIAELRQSLNSDTPVVSTDTSTSHEAHKPHPGDDIGLDHAVRIAQRQGLVGVLEVTPPKNPSGTYVVKEDTRSWPVRQDSVAVSASTGQVTDTVRFDDYPVLAKLSRWGIDAHMGLLFGLPNQIVLALLAIGLITLVVLGYRMWWVRGGTRSPRPGRAPVAGAWRRVPGKVLAPLVLMVALLAYCLPWFGIPLVGFLSVDALLSQRRSHASLGQEESS